MKKLFFAFLSMITMSAFAQIEVKTDGKVGIGTVATSLSEKLVLKGGNFYFDNILPAEPFIYWNSHRLNLKSKSLGIPVLAVRGSGNSAARLEIYDAGDIDIKTMIRASGHTYFNGGNVGIGTTNPSMNLQINGGGSNHNNILSVGPADWFTFGNVSGHGFINWFSKSNSNLGGTSFINTHSVNKASSIRGGDGTISFYTSPNNAGAGQSTGFEERMRILADGNVGIGTTDTFGKKLAVNGNAAFKDEVDASEFRVYALGSNSIGDAGTSPLWPDYVFEKDYKLLSLKEVEKHIKEKKHLPNIPSAKEVEEKGSFSLGEMNKKLLEKVEELTLYLIDQNKQLEKQAKRIKALEDKLANKKG